ncbi:MAG: hypothetical protein ACI8QD_000156 [Cyclobacteriaceae bacterium]|jgi:hypothetical protein
MNAPTTEKKPADVKISRRPHQLLKSHIDRTLPGKILIPDDHFGINSLYSAKHGWTTHTFSIDPKIIHKFTLKIKSDNLPVRISDGGYEDLALPEDSVDMIAFLSEDVPKQIRQSYFRTLLRTLKKGGMALVEAHHPDGDIHHIEGELLMNEQQLKEIFRGFSSLVVRRIDDRISKEDASGPDQFRIQAIAIK